MQENNLEHWEDLIDAVDKPVVPYGFISRIELNFQNSTFNKTIDVKLFRLQGKTEEEVEIIISDYIDSVDNRILYMDIVIDVEKVAKIVQDQTNLLLKNIL